MPAAPEAIVEQLSGLISWHLTRIQTSTVWPRLARHEETHLVALAQRLSIAPIGREW